MSVDGGHPTGHSLLIGPSKLTFVQDAGKNADQDFSVTNTGATTQTVSAQARALTPATDTTQDVVLGAAAPVFRRPVRLAASVRDDDVHDPERHRPAGRL